MSAKVTTLLKVNQGVDFTAQWVWETQDEDSAVVTPKNMTGWTAYCQIRATPAPNGFVLQDNVPVVLGATDGTVTLSIPAEMSWAWTWDMGMYDVVLFDDSGRPVARFAEGRVDVDLGATKKP